MLEKVMHASSHSICGPLEPILARHSLFRSEEIHKCVAEKAEMIGILNVAV
jgi:hypothetical protein